MITTPNDNHQHDLDENGLCKTPGCAFNDPVLRNRFLARLEAGKNIGMLKVHITYGDELQSVGVAGESFWVWPIGMLTPLKQNKVRNRKLEKISGLLCRVCNIPYFTDKFSIDDLILVDVNEGGLEFIKTIDRINKTWTAIYDGDVVNEVYAKLTQAISDVGIRIKIEGAKAGVMKLAAPKDMEFERVQLIYQNACETAGCEGKICGPDEDVPALTFPVAKK